MYPNAMPDSVEVTGFANFYVRSAIHRGIAAVEDTIENGKKLLELEREKDLPSWAVESMEGMIAYHEQLLREMKQFIPEALQ